MKRPNGLGSISRIAKGRHAGKYEARVTVGFTADGRPIRRSTKCATYDDAERALKQLRRKHTTGSQVGEDPTISQWLDEWLRQRQEDPDLENATWSANEIQVRVHLKPLIGHRRLRDFKKDDAIDLIHKLRNKKTKTGRTLSANTIRQIVNTADLAFEGAVPDRIPANPFHRVKRPKRNPTTRRAMTEDEVAKFYRFLDESVAFRDVAPIVTVLLECGLREGEVLGLTWDDVTLDSRRSALTVDRSLKRHRHKDDATNKFKTTTRIGSVKTTKARRTFKISKRAVEAFNAQRRTQDATRKQFTAPNAAGLRAVWGDGKHDFVFTTGIGTTFDHRNVQRFVKEATIAAGLGAWSPHKLRHTFGSRLFNAGVPLEMISQIMGHADTRTTYAIYVHPADDYADPAADALDRLAG